MVVEVLSTNPGLINLNEADQLAKFLIRQFRAHAMAPVPSSLVGIEPVIRWICRAPMPFLLASMR
jgi:hypothetical protein